MPDLTLMFIMTTRNMHVERHRRWRVLFGVTELRDGLVKEQIMLLIQHHLVTSQKNKGRECGRSAILLQTKDSCVLKAQPFCLSLKPHRVLHVFPNLRFRSCHRKTTTSRDEIATWAERIGRLARVTYSQSQSTRQWTSESRNTSQYLMMLAS